MNVYFNEIDKYPAEWLGNLFPGAHIDARSIKDVRPVDTTEFIRCHFFAGIGGWELALQLAGWPANREVWTGSCPCQPFSQAGKRKGKEDERHLWPDFLRLIAERRPSTIFGEQVASPDGRRWLAGVRSDVEALGYRFGAADLCAAGIGAPHNRPRLYWVAALSNSNGARTGVRSRTGGRSESGDISPVGGISDMHCSGCYGTGLHVCEREPRQASVMSAGSGKASSLCDSEILRERSFGRKSRQSARPQEPVGRSDLSCAFTVPDTNIIESSDGRIQRSWSIMQPGQNPPYLQWGNTAIICADGKARRIEPSILPLAHGIPNRVGRIRAYGNAIVPQLAAKFIEAFLLTET